MKYGRSLLKNPVLYLALGIAIFSANVQASDVDISGRREITICKRVVRQALREAVPEPTITDQRAIDQRLQELLDLERVRPTDSTTMRKTRGKDLYKRDFTTEALIDFYNLGDQQGAHVVEFGGEGVAVDEMIETLERSGKRPPDVTLVSYKTDHHATDGFRVIKGRLMEEIDASEIGQYQLGFDNYGPFAYTRQPDVILQKYLDGLAEGGRLYIHLGSTEMINKRLDIVGPMGEQLVFKWLDSIPGVKVEILAGRAIRFTMLNKSIARVPPLDIIEFRAEMPPYRTFQLRKTESEQRGNKPWWRQVIGF